MKERRKTESMDRETNKILFGQGLSPGLAIGKIWLYESMLPDESRDQAIHESEVQRQQTRIDRAVMQVGLDLAGAAEQAEQELNKDLAQSVGRIGGSSNRPLCSRNCAKRSSVS